MIRTRDSSGGDGSRERRNARHDLILYGRAEESAVAPFRTLVAPQLLPNKPFTVWSPRYIPCSSRVASLLPWVEVTVTYPEASRILVS